MAFLVPIHGSWYMLPNCFPRIDTDKHYQQCLKMTDLRYYYFEILTSVKTIIL